MGDIVYVVVPSNLLLNVSFISRLSYIAAYVEQSSIFLIMT
jgi:hypothetical protein